MKDKKQKPFLSRWRSCPKCGGCKVPNCGGRLKGMTRQGEKRRGWPKGKLRGPRKVAA